MSWFSKSNHEYRITQLEKSHDGLSKKYAKIWVEQVITRVIWAIGGIALSAWVADITGVLEKLL